MVKQSKLLAVNACAFILLVLQAFTGAWIYIDFHRKLPLPHELITLHPILGLSLIVIVLIHLYMNRRWVAMQLKWLECKDHKRPNWRAMPLSRAYNDPITECAWISTLNPKNRIYIIIYTDKIPLEFVHLSKDLISQSTSGFHPST